MKTLFLDRTKCIGCAICAQLAPSVFYMDESTGKANLFGCSKNEIQLTNDWLIEKKVVYQSKEQCPVKAISIK